VLKITMSATATEDRRILQRPIDRAMGQRIENGLAERQGADQHRRRCMFDMSEVTFVDKTGQKTIVGTRKRGCAIRG
jgi:anti-anti-sigma regulatory factor